MKKYMNKQIIVAALALFSTVGVEAQSGTNSPYSQYGLGILSDQSQGFSRGMNGVGLALRKGNVVNTLNPASYSAVDSLTMIFDVALSGQITNFKEGNRRMNVNNADFEYAVGSFRLLPKVGASFGITPYSNIGYDYSTTQQLNESFGSIPIEMSGSGGLHQVFVGAGWNVIKPLSLGINVAYLWGTLNRSIQSGSSTYIDDYSRGFYANVSSYLLTLGAQWEQSISAADRLTLGLTVGLGHKLRSNVEINNGDSIVFADTQGLELPMSYGLGFGWTHGNKLFLGADVTMQKWGSVEFPGTVQQGAQKVYALRKDLLKDRYAVNIGADYVPSPTSRTYINRVHYRLGVGYATPYYYINGKEGPKEFSVSAGFGIPLQNVYNNRSILNVSAQWARTSAKDLITDNTFRVTLGLTFNERWFAKWKVD
jgi:hypothetical protein